MTLMNSVNDGRLGRAQYRSVPPHGRRIALLLPVQMGKGFPFSRELKSNFSSAKSGSEGLKSRRNGIQAETCEYIHENKPFNSISKWVPETSTLVSGVQLGIANQAKTSSPKWQALLQDPSFERLDGFMGHICDSEGEAVNALRRRQFTGTGFPVLPAIAVSWERVR
jgi:hypothetical protein